MKKSSRYSHYITLFLFCQALALCSLFLNFSSARADEGITLTDDQKGAISVGCGSIKSTLSSLQKTDSSIRVHLGTSYQTIYSNFLTPMNLRLVKNSLLSADSINIYNNFNATRNNFNQAFIDYSRSLEDLLSIDCKTDPENFYAALLKARELRANVAEAASDMNRLINNHVNAVKKLYSSNQETTTDV